MDHLKPKRWGRATSARLRELLRGDFLRHLLALPLVAVAAWAQPSTYFTDITPVFSGTGSNLFNAQWADFDNDNDLDLYLVGTMYRNDGSTVFTAVGTVGGGERKGVCWTDYDRDGDADLASVGGGNARIYRNDGNGAFNDINAPLQGVHWAAAAWGDHDNDGKPDLLLTGSLESAASTPFTALYRNAGNDLFVPVPGTGLPAVRNSSVAWADFDRDGRLDVLMNGLSSGPLTWFAEIYRNNGDGTFAGIGAGFTGGSDGAVDAGDYDQDGFLDALVTGFKQGTYVLHVYHNNTNGSFTETSTLQGVQYGDATWVDFDNNGRLDILVTGCTANYCDYSTARIYRNNGDGTFSDLDVGLPAIAGHPASWGDYDKDGDLDLFLGGLYRNDVSVSNSPPTAPAGLAADLLPDNNVLLRWTSATDAQNTNPAALSYVVRVGTTPGGVDYLAPHADVVSGFRRLPARGPVNTSAAFLRDVPKGTYFWSVQAVDAGLAGSPFSIEASFDITNARPSISAIPDQATVPGRVTAPISFTISDLETPAAELTLSGSSTNTALVPNGNIIFGGRGANRTVTVTPAGGLSGTTVIAVAVTDGAGVTTISRFILTVQMFNETAAGLPTVTAVPSAWGDYDNDGDLDVATITADRYYTTVYRNTDGFFTKQSFTLPAALQYITPTDLAWLDFDNDGDLDLAESGWVSSGYQPVTYRFRNNFPANNFTNISMYLPGTGVTNVADGAMAWGDYDNDGDLDVCLAGDTNTYHSPDAFSALYRNDSGVFTNSGAVFPALVRGAAAWGDYDNDGDLDLLLAGQTGRVATNSLTRLFRNDGNGTFTPVNASFPGVTDCALAFGDLDNDGDLDIAMAGTGINAVPLARIYRNTGNDTFTQLNASLTGVTYASVAWGDFDNNGFADLVVSGSTRTEPYYNPSAVSTKVYHNNAGASFTDLGATLPSAMMQNTSWGDADNDGDLDVLAGTRLARNNWNISNAPPTGPTNLSVVIESNNAVLLSWSPSADPETADPRGLNYNIRLGTTPGGVEIVSPLSAPVTGYRRVPQAGNAGQTNAWRIHALTNGTYYWGVQAVDAGYAASPFASEGVFTLSRPVISAITSRSVPPNTVVGPIAFTVSDLETAAANLVLSVTSSDSDLAPPAGLVLAGFAAERTLTIVPASNRSGVTTITIHATDENGQTGSRSFVVTFERFADIGAGLTARAGPVAWGDFNNDGWLDLLKGEAVYQNLGNGTFTNLTVNLLNEGFGAFNDYDRDGNLDWLAVSANTTLLYRGDGNGGFANINAGFAAAGLSRQFGAWGDYDNDGDPDVALAAAGFTRVYRNNGTNFTDIFAGLPTAGHGSVAWGDYDKDGDLDLLLAGNGLTRLYRNNGNGTFTDTAAGLPAISYASVAWGDFDNDGWLDFAMCGSTNTQPSGVTTRIYRNTTLPTSVSRVFTNFIPVAAQAPAGVWKGTVLWGDYDNDGDLDLLVSGESITNGPPGFIPLTRLYRNDNDAFVDSGHALPALRNSFAAWGDYDNDGALDLALSGNDGANAAIARIYRNFANGVTNTPPAAPVNLTNVVARKSLQLSWGAATDPNESAGLTYNLRVGTAPGAGDILSPLSLPDGTRKVAALGNVHTRQSWTLTNLLGGTYYWTVQTVDASFAGSPFAGEGVITVSNLAPLAVGLSVVTGEDVPSSITLTGSDPDGDPVTFTIATPPLFGQLVGTPPQITYLPQANYFGLDQFEFRANDRTTDSPSAAVFIEVTPVEDLPGSSLSLEMAPGGQARIEFLGEPWRSHRIEVSTNLVYWAPFTNLLSTNLLTPLLDTDAGTYPQRFYRAVTP